ncbi:MAG TPA: hypothetical protein VGC94_04710 [Amnibacterium sp.]|jgi:hypothetical protein
MTLQAVPNQQPGGRWTWEAARANTRAVRVSPHPPSGLVTLSLWREDRCVGSLRLSPAEVAGLVGKLTGALAELQDPSPQRVRGLEERVHDLEARLAALEAEAAG